MSLRKDFSSLRKRVTSGFQPKNLLRPKVHTIDIPDESTINKGAICIVNPKDTSEKVQSTEMKTCFFLPLSILESGLSDKPLLSVDLLWADYNGTIIEAPKLRLIVSSTKDSMALVSDEAYIDKLAIVADTVESAAFSEDHQFMLLILKKTFGYFYLHFSSDDSELLLFLNKTAAHWGLQESVSRQPDLEPAYKRAHQRHMDLTKDPETLIRIEDLPQENQSTSNSRSASPQSDSDAVLKNGLPIVTPTKPLPRHNTRSTTRLAKEDPNRLEQVKLGDSGTQERQTYDEDEPQEQEQPASFDPPLKYSLSNGKKFTINYNDFKTLYNNDWINDTIIDFFIAYEIDKAISETHAIKEDDVYAFNSFFFTKLMSKSDELAPAPNYYENIRRWLSKIDLLSYKSVVIPVNEYLHWYCLVIKNLPLLVRTVKAYKVKESLEIAKKGHANDLEKLEDKEPAAEVFVFDSLRHKHPNIEEPLREVIDKYCQEKLGIEVPGKLIKFVNAPVPRQRNFNDCGIHVICNVARWLLDPRECETMWRTNNKIPKNFYGSIIQRQETRRSLIKLLLELREMQPPDESQSTSAKEEDESDGEIELISYHTSKPEEKSEENKESAEAEKSAEHLESMQTDANEKDDSKKEDLLDLNHNDHEEQRQEEPKTLFDALKMPEKTPTKEAALDKENLFKITEDDESSESPSVKKSSKQEKNVTPRRTLDPRVYSPMSQPKKTCSFVQIEHPDVRYLCRSTKVKPHTVHALNDVFKDHTKKLEHDKESAVLDFIGKYNFFDPKKERIQAEHLLNTLKDSFKAPPAPMEEPFVIHDADDSSGELNRSVGELRITSDDGHFSDFDKKRSKSKKKKHRNNDEVEILSDELQIVTDPESSIDFSTPQKVKRSDRKSRKKAERPVVVEDDIPESEVIEDVFLPVFHKGRIGHGSKRRRVEGK